MRRKLYSFTYLVTHQELQFYITIKAFSDVSAAAEAAAIGRKLGVLLVGPI